MPAIGALAATCRSGRDPPQSPAHRNEKGRPQRTALSFSAVKQKLDPRLGGDESFALMRAGSLDLDGRAGFLELLLDLLGLVLVDAFLDGLGSRLDQRLG